VRITRRAVLLATAGLGGCSVLPRMPAAATRPPYIGNRDIMLTARPTKLALMPDKSPVEGWLYDDETFPVLRMKKGETLSVSLKNNLREHSSIHWHGVRGPNGMDGVPYLTQLPVQPGETFHYRFVPPDAGTFFFHPHCNTAEQMGRGLIGALIVEDERDRGFDDDQVLVLKDWRLDDAGKFLPFLTPSGASRSGSFGAWRTVNGQVAPRLTTRADANIRLRLINADPTRISQLGITGAEARIIAIDGNAVTPFALDGWRLGPGMRLDLDLRSKSADIQLLDYFAASPVLLATLSPQGSTARQSVALAPPQNASLDLNIAWRHTLQLTEAVDAQAAALPPPIILPDGRRVDVADSLCLSAGTFWTLDGKAWPDRDHKNLPPPLFSFSRGENVVLEFENTTSRAHPIHIHGHTMKVLSTSLLKRPLHRADTVLVLPNERVTIGFVADNPGNWMIHCHIIEHQETGMMGWFHVS
jgi:FtsP/CotA-like multicopper oxidase with cupredoxin domain